MALFGNGVLTYDPKKVIVVFGSQTISGFAEDEMITIAPSGDGYTKYVGADGEVARAIDPNDTFTVTLHLAYTSKSNSYLSKMHSADRLTGSFLVPLMIKDLSGDTLFVAEQAWVANWPESTRGRGIETQDWELETGRVIGPVLGGNR